MKKAAIITAILALGVAAVWHRSDRSHTSNRSYAPADPVEVFQKAFWKRPTAEDHVLHAAREGTRWFLVVQPSAALAQHLRENFLHVPGTVQPIDNAPSWFTPQGSELRAARMQLCFTEKDQLLYATGVTGGGFQPGAPAQPAIAAPALTSTGRLPLTSPPDPSKP
jgi:hypothetical protein